MDRLPLDGPALDGPVLGGPVTVQALTADIPTLPPSLAAETRVRLVAEGLYLLARGADPATGQDRRDLLRHAAVVEAAAACGPVLPMRFGIFFAGIDRAIAAVAAEADRYRRRLEHVRGHVEVALHVATAPRPETDGPADTPADGTGRADGNGRLYLQRLARAAAIPGTAGPVHRALSAMARSVVLSRPRPGQAFRAAYLIPASSLAQARAEVAAASGAAGVSALLLTGPWPPYSFTAEEGPPA